MGPLHRLASLFNTSVIDANHNYKTMGVKGKKHTKFASDLDIFARESERIKNKTYIWTSIRLPKKNNKGNIFIRYLCTFKFSRLFRAIRKLSKMLLRTGGGLRFVSVYF